jgi:hypothetical protein
MNFHSKGLPPPFKLCVEDYKSESGIRIPTLQCVPCNRHTPTTQPDHIPNPDTGFSSSKKKKSLKTQPCIINVHLNSAPNSDRLQVTTAAEDPLNVLLRYRFPRKAPSPENFSCSGIISQIPEELMALALMSGRVATAMRANLLHF